VKKFKFVVFDLDGTLIRNTRAPRYVFKKIFSLNPDFLLGRFFISRLILREKYCPKLILILWEKLNILVYEIFDKLEKSFYLFEGVKEILEKLSENQVKMFLITAGSKSLKAERKLEKLGILNFFEKVSGRELAKEKAIVLFAEYVGINLNHFCKKASFISDGLRDMFIARRFGIYGIGVTNTFSAKMLKKFGAKKVISSFKELKKL